jgi:hypothetical protein
MLEFLSVEILQTANKLFLLRCPSQESIIEFSMGGHVTLAKFGS